MWKWRLCSGSVNISCWNVLSVRVVTQIVMAFPPHCFLACPGFLQCCVWKLKVSSFCMKSLQKKIYISLHDRLALLTCSGITNNSSFLCVCLCVYSYFPWVMSFLLWHLCARKQIIGGKLETVALWTLQVRWLSEVTSVIIPPLNRNALGSPALISISTQWEAHIHF